MQAPYAIIQEIESHVQTLACVLYYAGRYTDMDMDEHLIVGLASTSAHP